MPRRDGTGPMGAGSMTGRGLGSCTGAKAANSGAGLKKGSGMGLACRRGGGFARDLSASDNASKTQKEILLAQKNLLQKRLAAIEKQLEKQG